MSTLLICMTDFDKIASSLFHNQKYYPHTNLLECDLYRVLGLDRHKHSLDEFKIAIIKFVSELALSNNYAHEERYQIEIDNACIPNIDCFNTFDNLCQFLKKIRCIRYNCDLDKKSQLLIKLNELIDVLMHTIIEQLQDYQNAEWG